MAASSRRSRPSIKAPCRVYRTRVRAARPRQPMLTGDPRGSGRHYCGVATSAPDQHAAWGRGLLAEQRRRGRARAGRRRRATQARAVLIAGDPQAISALLEHAGGDLSARIVQLDTGGRAEGTSAEAQGDRRGLPADRPSRFAHVRRRRRRVSAGAYLSSRVRTGSVSGTPVQTNGRPSGGVVEI